MAIWWRHILGRFAARQDFPDGTYIRPTSRESLAIFGNGPIIEIEFIRNADSGEYVFYLPKTLGEAERKTITAKILDYGSRKHLRLRQDDSGPASQY